MWRTVWAEDGLVFYSDALHHSIVHNIFRPYAGYGLGLSRIVAQVGTVVPVERYSLWITVTSTLVVSLLALFVYWASAPVLRAPIRRAVLAGSMVLLPVLPVELLGTISNLQWFFPVACLFAVLLPVERPWAIAARLPIVVLGPLSSPFTLMFAPIVVAQLVVAYRRRSDTRVNRVSLVVPCAYLVACLGQLVIYSGAKHEPRVAVPLPDTVRSIVRLYPTKVATDLVFGVHTTPGLWRSFGYGLAAIAMVMLAAMVVVKIVSANTVSRLWIIALVVGGAALFVTSVVVRSGALSALVIIGHGQYDFAGSRYEVVPAFLLILALLVPPDLPSGLLVDVPSPVPTPPPPQRLAADLPWRGLVAVAAAWCIVAVVPSFRFDNGRSPGPSWGAGVRAAQQACETQIDAALQIVAISPAPIWTVPMTCAELRGTGDS